MTISTTPAARVSINALCLLAYKRAGIVPVEARLSGANMVAKLEHARQVLLHLRAGPSGIGAVGI